MPLKLYDRGGIWWYRGTVAGRRIHESTRTTDRKTAERIANRAEAREFKRDLDGPAAILTFGAAAALYLDADRSDRFIKTVIDYWKNTLVKDITPGAIKLAAIKSYPKAGPATRNRQFITPTIAIINHASTLGLCTPLLKVDRFPVPKKRRDEADWKWVEAFCAESTAHLAALVKFGYLTGSRISNMTNLMWRDAAWLAGLMDGEGAIWCRWPKRTNVLIEINMTHRRTLERVQSLFPGRLFLGVRSAKSLSKIPQYRWQLDTLGTAMFLEWVAPYMFTKREAAFAAIELCKRPIDREHMDFWQAKLKQANSSPA